MAVEDKVKICIAEKLKCDIDTVVLHADLVMDLGADSIDLVELHMDLEIKFDLDISYEDAEGLHTVQDVIDYIESHC